jgi:hypothetical protein
VRGGIATALLATAVGCSFASPGGGLDGPAPADSEGTTGGAAPGETSALDATGVGGDHGGVEASTGQDGPPDSTSDGVPAGEGQLVIVQSPVVALGDLPLSAPHAFSLTLENVGDGPATAIVPPTLASPYAWTDDVYPGTGGTCGEMLAGGDSCTMELTALPVQPGIDARTIEFSYVGAMTAKTIGATLELSGVGTGDNLLVNPGAEDGASGAVPPAWVVGNGASWQATDGTVDEGSLSFYPGDPGTGSVVTLYQEVPLDGYQAAIDGPGLGIAFSSRARTESVINDPHNLRVVYYNIAHEVLAQWESGFHDSTGWHSHDMTQAIPAMTTTVRVELQCERQWGTNCDAWFDALSLRAVYPPP